MSPYSHFISTTTPSGVGSQQSHGLLSALTADHSVHPERLNATLGRIGEVLEIVNGGQASAAELFYRCREAAGQSHGLHQSMSAETALKVGAVLTGALDAGQLEYLTELVWQSELSTDEVVELHKRFKIPVSHLEDDLLPVQGDGALITDSKGAVYIDLDSNYSATLRWMPPLVITEAQVDQVMNAFAATIAKF